MGYRFNSPPGWPPPPEGWTPPPGWQPDPSWPPAPQGWEFWVTDGAGQQAAAPGGVQGPAPGADQQGPAPGADPGADPGSRPSADPGVEPGGSAEPTADAQTSTAGAAADTSQSGEPAGAGADAAEQTLPGSGAVPPAHGGASDAPTQAFGGAEAPTQAFADGGAPTEAFGAASGPSQQGPADTSGAPGATAAYQYQPSGHLDQPGASPYGAASAPGAHGGAHDPSGGYQQGGYAPGGYPQGGHQQGGYQGAPPPGHAHAQGGYPGGPQGTYPGSGTQGAPGEGKKSNTGIIIGAIVAAVLVLGLLVWGGIALFGGSDDDPVVDPDPEPATTEPAEPDPEPTDTDTDPTDTDPTEDPEPTEDPAGTDDDNGPATGADGAVLALGEHAVIAGTESAPQVTLAVTGVESWEAEPNSFFCTESEVDEFIEISVEITTHDLPEPYEFSGMEITVADADGETFDEVNPFMGILCDNPNRIDSPLSANETHTGSIILDVPSDATYVVWQEMFDFTGEAPTYMWEY